MESGHRLDREGVDPRQAPDHGAPHPAQVRIPARQAGEGDGDRPGAGRADLRAVGGVGRSTTTSRGELEPTIGVNEHSQLHRRVLCNHHKKGPREGENA